MSFYNLVCGENPEKEILLKILNISQDDFGRFRDIYLNEDGTKIIVLTRNGGGNREYYEHEFKNLKNHKNYICDYDDDFDDTYAYIEFNVPDEYKEFCKEKSAGEEIKSVGDKFLEFMQK